MAVRYPVRDNARLRIITPDNIIKNMAGKGADKAVMITTARLICRPLSRKAARVVR